MAREGEERFPRALLSKAAREPLAGVSFRFERSQHRGTIGIFYTLLGHEYFGATGK
jgi:hypothetical protein